MHARSLEMKKIECSLILVAMINAWENGFNIRSILLNMLKMLTAGGGQTVSKHHQHPIQQSSRENLYSVPGCSGGCYYG